MFKALGMGKEHLKSDEGGRTMSKTLGIRWLVVAAGAAMLLVLGAACTKEVEVPGETIIVEKEVVKTVEVPGETIVVEKEVIKTVEIEVPGKTVTVTKEVIKEVEVPGETVVVTKEVIKEVEVPGKTVVVTKEVLKVVEVRQGYVTDPTTGKAVSAPQYGGTITYGDDLGFAAVVDTYYQWVDPVLSGVVEKLGIGNWAIDRNEWAFNSAYTPLRTLTGALAESWETPDDTTIVLNIRKGVQWHDKPPMNGREFTADDMVFNYHRYLGLGSGFTERSPGVGAMPIESITASDKWTVVFKLERPGVFALQSILDGTTLFMYPPEVIKEHGDAKDWRNLVGTGPFMLTDYVEGSSLTFIKNPDYWGYDEKYPQNRLPYSDKVRNLFILEKATVMAALRSGKIDYRGYAGGDQITSLDQAESLEKTNPEIAQWPFREKSAHSLGVNVNNPPLNDIRVRKALQMAIDLETINRIFFKGRANWTPTGQVGNTHKGFYIPFDEWPEEVKKGYMYDPEGAEKLLDDAGLPRGADGIRFKTSFLAYQPWINLSYYELAITYFAEIGVDVEIQLESSVAALAAKLKQPTADSFELRSSTAGKHYFGEFLLSEHYSGANWNPAAVSDPDYDAIIDALRLTTDLEEYKRLFREADMYMIERHWNIWGPDSPMYNVTQPWVKGYNGETILGQHQRLPLIARLWIDQELKEAIGH